MGGTRTNGDTETIKTRTGQDGRGHKDRDEKGLGDPEEPEKWQESERNERDTEKKGTVERREREEREKH